MARAAGGGRDTVNEPAAVRRVGIHGDSPLSLEDLHAGWHWSAIVLLILASVFLAAQFIDERTLLGVSVWSKPFKFALSLFLFTGTLYLMSGLVSKAFWRGRGRAFVGIMLFMVAFDMVYIAWQAGLGEASHFNNSTPFYQVMYSLMGVAAVTMVGLLVWLAAEVAREARWRLLSQPLVLAVVLGLVLTFLLGGGFGGYLSGNGSHFVGPGVSDADGLWLVKWSREVGDLRVAHFFGMHAMPVIPLFALALRGRLSVQAQVVAVIAFSAAYSAMTVGTFVQALSGEPFLNGTIG